MSKLSMIKVASLLGRADRVAEDKSAPDRARAPDFPAKGIPQDIQTLAATVRALAVEAQSGDPWTSRARPTFLYIMYAMILWAVPIGLLAAINPRISQAIVAGMTGYLSALPEELYTLFGTGYLGYATLRQWGKVKGSDR